MSNAAAIALKCIITAECFAVSAGNIFTIFVFWKNRKNLKRTSFLLINLAVADLLVGLSTPIAIGAFNFNSQFQPNNTKHGQAIFGAFHKAFYATSVLFLLLISMERAYALIWPLRHRIASSRGYVYSVIFVWMAGMSVGGLSLLAVYRIIRFAHWIVTMGTAVVISLAIVCVSYLAIRTKLNYRGPAIESANNIENFNIQNKKLSRTLFVVIAASLVFWLPSTIVICIYVLCKRCVPSLLLYIATILQVTNSLVNPVIYCCGLPVFKETLKRMRLSKFKSKQYRVHYRP